MMWLGECGWTSCLGEEKEKKKFFFIFLEFYRMSSLVLFFVIITFFTNKTIIFCKNVLNNVKNFLFSIFLIFSYWNKQT